TASGADYVAPCQLPRFARPRGRQVTECYKAIMLRLANCPASFSFAPARARCAAVHRLNGGKREDHVNRSVRAAGALSQVETGQYHNAEPDRSLTKRGHGMWRLLCGLVSGLVLSAAPARADEAEDRAVEFVKKLGGKITRDDTSPEA